MRKMGRSCPSLLRNVRYRFTGFLSVGKTTLPSSRLYGQMVVKRFTLPEALRQAAITGPKQQALLVSLT
jgi:hypothetical protein